MCAALVRGQAGIIERFAILDAAVHAETKFVGEGRIVEVADADQVAVEIVSKKGTAFLVSADEYRSLKETVYLLQSPRNAERLRQSIAQLRAGDTEPHELAE